MVLVVPFFMEMMSQFRALTHAFSHSSRDFVSLVLPNRATLHQASTALLFVVEESKSAIFYNSLFPWNYIASEFWWDIYSISNMLAEQLKQRTFCGRIFGRETRATKSTFWKIMSAAEEESDVELDGMDLDGVEEGAPEGDMEDDGEETAAVALRSKNHTPPPPPPPPPHICNTNSNHHHPLMSLWKSPIK
jgi:hypothetical protein